MTKTVRKVVFPVAGLGTRFLPATKAVPKEMLPLVDRPLIEYAVDEARGALAADASAVKLGRFPRFIEAIVAKLQAQASHERGTFVWREQSTADLVREAADEATGAATGTAFDLGAYMEEKRLLTESVLDASLSSTCPETDLIVESMRYSLMAGGKRVRPMLCYAATEMFGGSLEASSPTAVALEMIHTMSLIHDDLPAMDNDDFRRGKPTNHVLYGDDVAILAGDALLTLAFDLIADPAVHASASVRLEASRELARAAGHGGMAGGQMLDLASEHRDRSEQEVRLLQAMKTGALINYAVEIGTILREVEDHIRRALEGFAHDLGLAYQITDDLLDATGDQAEMGKAAGKDAGQGKATFVTILGVEGARDRSRHLAAQAKDHLEPFGARAEVLREAVDFILDRRS